MEFLGYYNMIFNSNSQNLQLAGSIELNSVTILSPYSHSYQYKKKKKNCGYTLYPIVSIRDYEKET